MLNGERGLDGQTPSWRKKDRRTDQVPSPNAREDSPPSQLSLLSGLRPALTSSPPLATGDRPQSAGSDWVGVCVWGGCRIQCLTFMGILGLKTTLLYLPVGLTWPPPRDPKNSASPCPSSPSSCPSPPPRGTPCPGRYVLVLSFIIHSQPRLHFLHLAEYSDPFTFFTFCYVATSC